jgi:uncharacterized spore protein YtfJ
MTMNNDDALQAATQRAAQAASEPMDGLLERLAELIGGRASVQAVFGEPVRHDQVTIVPVARIRWGFGGGGGSADQATDGSASGSGGGGGVAADPVGYLEIAHGAAEFRPIRDPYPSPVLILAIAVSAAIVLRAVTRIGSGSGRAIESPT